MEERMELSLGTGYGLQVTATFRNDFFARFICDHRIGEKTVANYVTFLNHFSLWIEENGITNPSRDDIRNYQRHLDAYVSERTGKRLEQTTKAQYFQVVKTFFQFLECEGLYPDITKGIKGIKFDKTAERKRPFTKEEIKTIIDSIDTSDAQGIRNKAMILLSVENGLRIIEIQRANIEDLEIIDNRTRLYVQGKGKTEKADFVNLSQELAELIESYLKTRPDAKSGDALFTSTSNRSRERIAETSISRLFKQIFRESGFDSRKLTAHSLRHSSGTIYYEMTGDIYKVKNHQRHSDITSTTIYVHSNDRTKDASGQEIHDEIFGVGAEQGLDEESKLKLQLLIATGRLSQILNSLSI